MTELYKRVFVVSFFPYIGKNKIRAEIVFNVLDNVFSDSIMPSLRPRTSYRSDKVPPF